MADFGGDAGAFRAEVRGWLEANFPAALAKDPMAQLAKLQARPESPEATAWRKALGAKGWGAPTWPKEVGGGGLSRAEAKVLAGGDGDGAGCHARTRQGAGCGCR